MTDKKRYIAFAWRHAPEEIYDYTPRGAAYEFRHIKNLDLDADIFVVEPDGDGFHRFSHQLVEQST